MNAVRLLTAGGLECWWTLRDQGRVVAELSPLR
jgi:hypothetical protein